MNNRILSAIRMITFMLMCMCTFCLTSCGGDDDLSIDEILSQETTPIDFQLAEYNNRYDKYFLFDYAGNSYVGSDTVSSYKCTIDLRQGKHHLLWIKGIDDEPKYGKKYYAGIHYDPQEKTITDYGDSYSYSEKIIYSETDLEVTQYLMPVQQIRPANYICGLIQVEISDMSDDVEQPRDRSGDEDYDPVSQYRYSRPVVGTVSGFPNVSKVSLTGNDYTQKKESSSCDILLQYHYDRVGEREFSLRAIGSLCPKSGIDNIQLTVDMKDKNGSHIPTTALPRCSLKRGYTTVLRGPLFSGTTSDWTVTMEPF